MRAMNSNKPAEPQSFKGKKNMYVCRKCCGHVITVDVDAGVTPFMIRCLVTQGCTGMMQSSMYRVYDQTVRAQYEWFKPSLAQILTPPEAEHVQRGGLLLRLAKDAQAQMEQKKDNG